MTYKNRHVIIAINIEVKPAMCTVGLRHKFCMSVPICVAFCLASNTGLCIIFMQLLPLQKPQFSFKVRSLETV